MKKYFHSFIATALFLGSIAQAEIVVAPTSRQQTESTELEKTTQITLIILLGILLIASYYTHIGTQRFLATSRIELDAIKTALS